MADDFTNKFLKSYGYDVNSLINPKPIAPTVDILKTASDMQAGVSRQINQIMQTQQQLEQKQQKLAEFQQKKELEVQSIADFNNYKDGLNKSIGQLEADIGRPLNDTERLSTYTAYHKALISNLKGAGRDDLANQAQVRYNPKVLFSADQDKIIAQAEAAKKEAEAKKFGVGKFIKDVGVEAAAGLADLAVSASEFIGGGAALEGIGKIAGIEALQGLGGKAHSLIDDARKAGLSEYSLQNKRDQQAAMAEAEKNDDYLGQALSYLEDPASIVGNLIGSVGGAGLAAKGAAKIAGKLAPAIAESAARKAGVVGFGATTSGGSVKQSQRETAVQDALAAGYSQEDAQAIGERAAELNVQQLLGAAIGGVAGSSGLEKVFSKAGMGGKTVLGGALKGAAEEGIPEIAQGAQEQYAANAASIDQGVLSEDQAMRGVVGAGLGGGLIGGLAGGGIGAGVGAKNKYLGAPTDGASTQPAELTPSERVDLRTSFAKSGFNNEIKAKAAEFGLTPEDFVKSVGIAVDSGNGKTVVSTDTTPEVTTQTVENSAAPKEFKAASDALASIKSIRVQNPEAFQEFAPTIDAISSQTEAAKQFLTAAMRGGKSSVHFDSGHVESKINEINALNKLSNDTLQAMNKRLDVLKDIGDVGGQDAQAGSAQAQPQPKTMVDSIEPIAQEQVAETRISDQELKSASNEQLANLLSEALDKNQIVDTQKAQAQIKNLLNVESKPLSQKDLDDSRKVASTLLRNKGNPNYASANVDATTQAANVNNNIKAKRVVDYVPSTAKTNVDNLVMSVVRYKGKNGTLIKNFDDTASAFPYSVLTKDGVQIDISSEEVGSGNNVKIGVIGVVSSDGGMLYVDGRQEPITFSDDRSVVTKTKGEKARLYLEEYVVDAVKIAKQNNTGIESEDISDDLSIAIDDAKEAMDSLSDEKNEIPSLKEKQTDEAPKMSDKDIASSLVDWFTESLDNVADAEAQLNALERALKKEIKGIKGEKEREAATSAFFIRVLTPWLDDPTKPLKLEQKVSNDEQRRNNQDAVQPESRPTENTKGGTTVPESTGGSPETDLELLSNEKLANLLRKAVADGEIAAPTANKTATTLINGDFGKSDTSMARRLAISLLKSKALNKPQNVTPAQQELNIETPAGEANQAATEPVQDSVQEPVKSNITADERAKLSDADVARLQAARTRLEAAEKKVTESKGDEKAKALSEKKAATAEVKTLVAKAAAKGIPAKKAPVKKAPAKKENAATVDKNEAVETTEKAKAAAKPKQTTAEAMKNVTAASKRSSASKVTQNKAEKEIAPLRVNKEFVIDEKGGVHDDFRKKYEKLKNDKDFDGLNKIYSTVRVVLNGAAQSRGDKTVKQFQSFKKEMEDFSSSIKEEKSNKDEADKKAKTDAEIAVGLMTSKNQEDVDKVVAKSNSRKAERKSRQDVIDEMPVISPDELRVGDEFQTEGSKTIYQGTVTKINPTTIAYSIDDRGGFKVPKNKAQKLIIKRDGKFYKTFGEDSRTAQKPEPIKTDLNTPEAIKNLTDTYNSLSEEEQAAITEARIKENDTLYGDDEDGIAQKKKRGNTQFLREKVTNELFEPTEVTENTSLLKRIIVKFADGIRNSKKAISGILLTAAMQVGFISNDVEAKTVVLDTIVQNEQITDDANVVNAFVQKNGDNNGKKYIIADKKAGVMYVMNENGTVAAKTPALFGKDVGDDAVDGQTPAGRFNLTLTQTKAGDSYGGNVQAFKKGSKNDLYAIHRVYTGDASEARVQRLNSSTAADNRVSHGCINVPADFYDKYLNGYFSGAAYVIPETSSVKDMFPSGVQFSKSKNSSAKGQVSDVQKALVEMFGSKATFEQAFKNVDVEQSVTPEMVKSFEAGNFDVLNSNVGEKLSKYDDVQGYFNPRTGRITLIADNLPDAKTARAVFLHEVGHKQLPKMLGDKYSKFSDRIKAWDKAKAGSVEAKIYEKAKARADQSGETGSRYDDELIAYAIEESELAGVKVNPAVFDDKSAKGFLASVWRTMTNAMKKIFPSFKGYLTANDLVSLAYGAADLEIKNTDYVTDAKEEAIKFSMNLTLEAIPPKVKTSITEQAKKKVIASKQAGKDWIDRTSAVVSKGDGMTTLQKVSKITSGARRFSESYIFNAVDMDSLTDWTKREFIGDEGQPIMGDAVRAIKTSGADFRSAMADFQNEVGKPMFEADIKEQHPELTKLWSRATDIQYDPSGTFKSKKTNDTELDALYKALTPRAKVVYKNTMIAFSKQFDRKVKAFEKSLKASGFTDEEIAQTIGDIERLDVYMPRKQYGKYIISAYVKNEDGSNGEALAHEFFDGGFSGLMEDRVGKQLREKFGNDINVTKQKPLVERLRPSLSASQADVLAAHEARLKNSGLSNDEVKSQIDEFVKTLAGFGIGKLEQTQEQRTGVYSSGFERDQIRAIFDVSSSNEQLIAKFNNQAIIEKHLKAMDEHIDKNENKEGYDYLSARMAAKAVRDSYNYVQSNDIGQTLVSKVNALGFLTTMGFDMSQVPSQLSSLYNLALPHFVTRFSKDKKFATKQLGSNFYAALKMVRYGGTQEYLDALKVKASNGDKEAQAIVDKIEPAFMQLRANDRVSFTDLKDVENEIYGRSGIMQSIMKWSGTHLNITEQVVNLSIAMTAIELSKKNGMNQSQIDAQVDEALRRGNPNSTPTTKGLYSKTAIGRWLTMMRSYSMAVASRIMSDLRTLIALRKNRTDPDYIESRNRLVTTVVFQATMAGVVNVPTFMTAPIWAVLWAAKAMTADDEDDELTTDQWTRKIVEQTIGEDMTRLLRFGSLSLVGGDSLAKRMSFSDLVIKSANDDVNRDGVKDFFDELYANAPMTIGVTKRTQVAMSTFFDEITNPNIDKSESFSKLLTKSLPMKSVNSIAKGYESIKNDGQVYTADSTPLLEDSEKLNGFEIAAQILGIRPAGVVKAQDDRWALMSTKMDKENMQKAVRNSYKIAYANFIQGDATQEDVDAAKMVIDEFNKKYPLYAITDKALASARSRMDDNMGEILYSPINAKDAAKVEEISDRMPWLDREED